MKHILFKFAFPALCLLWGSCSSCKEGREADGENQGGTTEMTAQYANPVIRVSVPDPTAIRTADGTYYLYGTEDIRNLPIFRSDDLVHWTQVGTAFTDQSRPTEVKGASLWAPEIRYIKGKYVLFYSLAIWGQEWVSTIGYAVADKPEGPFTEKGIVFSSHDVGVQNSIDEFFYEDNGKYYMLWGSFSGLYIIELNVSDDLTITPKLETKQKIAGNAYEGVNLWKRGGYYYLFASRGSCCEGIRSTYTTVVGRSKNLFGPYVNKAGKPMLENGDELLLHGTEDNSFRGTGHNSILQEDDAHQTWMLYHAYYKPREDGNDGRSVSLDRVDWVDGWPVMGKGVPSTSAEVPVINHK